MKFEFDPDQIFPVFGEPIEGIIQNYYEKLGLLFTHLEIEASAITDITSMKPIGERILIDLIASPTPSIYESKELIKTGTSNIKVNISKIKKRITKTNNVFNFITESLPDGYNSEIFKREWHKGNYIYPARDGVSFFVDSRQHCPSWIFIGASKQFTEGLLKEQSTSKNSTGQEIDSYIEYDLGLRSYNSVGLNNFVAIRFIQNYVFIEENRIITDSEGKEKLYIQLSSEAPLAFAMFQSNRPYLNYKIMNSISEIIGQGEIELEPKKIKSGIYLPLLPDKKNEQISKAEIQLHMGGMLVDWSNGTYLRKINFNIKIEGK